jgi:hypothetical protein
MSMDREGLDAMWAAPDEGELSEVPPLTALELILRSLEALGQSVICLKEDARVYPTDPEFDRLLAVRRAAENAYHYALEHHAHEDILAACDDRHAAVVTYNKYKESLK